MLMGAALLAFVYCTETRRHAASFTLNLEMLSFPRRAEIESVIPKSPIQSFTQTLQTKSFLLSLTLK